MSLYMLPGKGVNLLPDHWPLCGKPIRFINEFECSEAKIEGSEKGRQLPEVEPRTPLTWAPSALPLSLDSRTTTNPHNPLCILLFHFPLFLLHNIQIHLFPAWGKMLSANQVYMAATQVLVARSSSNGDTVAVCGQFLPTFHRNVVYMLKRLWDGSRLFQGGFLGS